MAFQDQTLVCRDCRKEFIWKASDQDFFASKGYSAPLRCKDCRFKRKATTGTLPASSYRKEFDIVCANCEKPGKVPFEPSSKHTLLCTACFMRQHAQRPGISRIPRVIDNAAEMEKAA